MTVIYSLNTDMLKDNSLFKLRPDLIQEWDFEKNNKLGFDVYKVTKGSIKNSWWICPDCKSEYEATPNKRFSNRNCPYCAGKRINHTNSLASLNPELASQWHPTKNGELTPNDVSCGSDFNAYWICELHHDWSATVQQRNKSGSGCPYCSGHKVWIGYNDLWTTHKYLAEALKNHEEGYIYSKGSNVKVDWICPSCDCEIKDISILNATRRGLTCSICSENISIPEKIMSNILQSSSISFKHNHTFEWSNNRRYDFYLPEYNMIIETHGIQHYEKSFITINGRTLEEEQENDRYKRKLAFDNGISYYFEIDCRRSEMEYIKNNILNSEISRVIPNINLDMNFLIKNENMMKSWYLWNNGLNSTVKIGKELGLSKSTIRGYLLRGSEQGKCTYPSKKLEVMTD